MGYLVGFVQLKYCLHTQEAAVLKMWLSISTNGACSGYLAGENK